MADPGCTAWLTATKTEAKADQPTANTVLQADVRIDILKPSIKRHLMRLFSITCLAFLCLYGNSSKRFNEFKNNVYN